MTCKRLTSHNMAINRSQIVIIVGFFFGFERTMPWFPSGERRV
jgi:hypothetical protein